MKLLSLALILAGRVLVAALPTNATMVDDFVASFHPTAINMQSYTQGDLQNLGRDWAIIHDCRHLSETVAIYPGYWELSGWTSLAQEITANRSCHVRVSRQDGQDGRVVVGNRDIYNLLTRAAKVADKRPIAVMGTIYCWDNQQNTIVEVIISVMN